MQQPQGLCRIFLVRVLYKGVPPGFTFQRAGLVEEIVHLGDLATFGKHLDEGISCPDSKVRCGWACVSPTVSQMMCDERGPGTHSSTVGERLPMNSLQGSIGPVRGVDVVATDAEDDAVLVDIGATVVR